MAIKRTELAASLLPAVISNLKEAGYSEPSSIEYGVNLSLEWAEAFLRQASVLDKADSAAATKAWVDNPIKMG